jgi:hypothetical protein
MITKEELLRWLSVAYSERAKINGKIELINMQLKIVAEKEEKKDEG